MPWFLLPIDKKLNIHVTHTLVCLLCRRMFPPTKAAAELNAWMAMLTCKWLVGDMEVREGDVQVRVACGLQGSTAGCFMLKLSQPSIVRVKDCI